MGKLTGEQLYGLWHGVEYAGTHHYAGSTWTWTETWMADAERIELCRHPSLETIDVTDDIFAMQLRSSEAAERVPVMIDPEFYWTGDPQDPLVLRRLGNFVTVNLWVRAQHYEALMQLFDDCDDLVLDPWRHQLVWLYHDRMFPAAFLKGVGLDQVPNTIPEL
jgi:hypothetical protein